MTSPTRRPTGCLPRSGKTNRTARSHPPRRTRQRQTRRKTGTQSHEANAGTRWCTPAMLVRPPNGPEEGFMSPRSTGRSTIFAMNLSTVLAAGGFLLSPCQGAGTPGDPNAPGNPGNPAPAINAAVIPGAFIVVFNRSVADAPGLAKQLATDHGGTLRFTYTA